MRRRRRWLLWTVAAVALVLAGLTANSLRGRLGWTALPQTPEALARTLAPAYRWTLPAGPGPHPAAILLSGCDGPKPNLDRLAADLAAAGWAALIVDSHGPRGLDRRQAWRLVCAGQLLNGAERAADVAVALAALRARAGIDGDRVALIGMSHGGWAALDFLALAERGAVPPLLTDWPSGLGAPPWSGVRGVVLFYPYCGVAAVGGSAALPVAPGYRFLLVEDDNIAAEESCEAVAADLAAAGADVSVTLFAGVTHGFDQREKSGLSPLEFDAEATRAATARTLDFLASLGR